MKVAAGRFKEAVNKAIKGAGFNNLVPLTSMIGIKLEDGNLKLLTTDASNNLCVVIDKVAGDVLNITVDADKFGKLISKVTSDEIDLSVEENVLTIKANGTYKLPLIVDEEGLVSFPDIDMNISEGAVQTKVQLTSILSAYNINRPSLAKTLENPCLVGYYCGDQVISTDANVITFNNFNMFSAEPVLIAPQTMQLLTVNTKEDIDVFIKGSDILFVTDNIIVQGYLLDGIEQYPVEAISQYLDEAFTSSCKLPKELLLSVLDRLSLFIEPYDKNGAYFTFGRTGLTIHSKKNASTEILNYVESKDFAPFTCLVDIPALKEQLIANPDETIKLYYGNENALKLESGKIIQVVSLLEDETI